MADDRSITITILGKDENGDLISGGQQRPGTGEEGDNFGTVFGGVLHPIRTFEKEVIGKNVIVQQAYNTIKQSVISVVEDYHSRVFNLRESYLGEQNYSNVKAAIGRTKGFLESVGAGALAGGVAGAGVAAAGYLVTQGISRWQGALDYQQNMNATIIQTGFAATRLSLYNDSKGTEN